MIHNLYNKFLLEQRYLRSVKSKERFGNGVEIEAVEIKMEKSWFER